MVYRKQKTKSYYRGNNNKNPPLRIFGFRIFSLRLLFYFFLSKIFLAFIILLFPDQMWATRSLNFRQNLRFRLENTLKKIRLRRADRPCVYYSTFFCPNIFLRLLFYFFLSKISSCVYYSTFKGGSYYYYPGSCLRW